MLKNMKTCSFSFVLSNGTELDMRDVLLEYFLAALVGCISADLRGSCHTHFLPIMFREVHIYM